MPTPTILPLLNAVGLTLVILGSTLGWILSVVGGVLFLATTIRWVRDTRRDISELPIHHDAH